MSAAVAIARYLLDEASSGQSPATVVDDTGNGNDLSINYNGAFFAFTNEAAGNGLYASETVATAGSGVADLADIVNNGNIGPELHNATELSLLLRADCIAGHAYGMRVFHLGTSSGNGDFSVVLDVASLVVRWDDEAGGDGAYVYYFIPSGITTIAVVIDTTAVIAVDRCRVYFDASLQTANSGSLPQNSALGGINASDRYISLLNRPSLNRNPIAKLFYAELFTGQLTELQISAAHAALSLNNDANWDSASGTTPVSGSDSLQYNIAAQLSASDLLLWDMVSPVSGSESLSWDISELIGASDTLTWDVISLASVSGSDSISWDIATQISASDTLQYDMLALASGIDTLQYDITAQLSASDLLLWDIFNRVSGSELIIYDINQSIFASDLLLWDVLSIGAVSGSDSISWSMAGQVGASDSLQFDVLAAVADQDLIVWDTFQFVNDSDLFTWSMQGQVLAFDTMLWSIESLATSEFNYSILIPSGMQSIRVV